MSETPIEYDDLLDVTDHHWRNRLIGLLALAALIAVGAYALWAVALGGGGSTAAETQTATVQRGSISVTVSTTGVAVAQSTADLSFDQSGTVSAVNVTLGQEVKQGDVLAEIEPDELQSAVTTAELNLASAQAKLDTLLAGSTASELASADQSLLQAQANYDQANRALQDLKDGPSATDLLSAELAVASAQSQLDKAEQSRTNLYTTSDDAVTAAEDAVSKAEDALATAKSAAANTADSITSAKLSLVNAATTYCDTDDHLTAICADFATPLTNAEVSALTNSIGPDDDASDDLVKATTSLISANTSYKNAVASKTSADNGVASAEADLETAKNNLEDAKKGPSSADIASADNAVASAQLSLDDAKTKLADLKAGPTEDDLNDAQSSVNMASAALEAAKAKRDEVYAGSTASDIELQRGQVQQAQLSVEKARKDLENAKIVAPFDGTVADLNIAVGDLTSAAGTTSAIVLSTPDSIYLSLTITESDISGLKVGQSGIATFDALENQTFPITIESIGTSPTTTQGVVTYQAKASVQSAPPTGASGSTGSAATSATPLPGMNASITITVDQAQNVLMVPEGAVQTEGRNSVVEVQKDDGSTEKVTVQTGLSDGTNIEITQGLEEGQTVIIPTRAATTSAATQTAGTQQGAISEGVMPPGGPTGGGAP